MLALNKVMKRMKKSRIEEREKMSGDDEEGGSDGINAEQLQRERKSHSGYVYL